MDRKDRTSFEHLGWIVALIFLGGWFIYLTVTGIFDQTLCTGAEDEQCLRDWISALGSWAAVPAAIVTIVILTRQIRQDGENQRHSIRVAFQPSRSTAARAIAIADRSIERARQLKLFWEDHATIRLKDGAEVGASQEEFQGALKDIRKMIDDPIFAQCESQLLSGSVGDLALLRMHLLQHIDTAMQNSVYFKPAAQVVQVTSICIKLTTHAEQCIEASKKHLQDTNI